MPEETHEELELYTAIEERFTASMPAGQARLAAEHEIARVMSRELRKAAGDQGLTGEGLQRHGVVVLDVLGISDGRAACEIIRGVLDIMIAHRVPNAPEVDNLFGDQASPASVKDRRQAHAYAIGLTTAGVYSREWVGLEKLSLQIIELVKARGRRPRDQSVAAAIDGFRTAVQEQTALLRRLHHQ